MGFNSSLKTDYRESMYLLLLQQVHAVTRNSESSKPLSRKSLYPRGAKGRWWANLRAWQCALVENGRLDRNSGNTKKHLTVKGVENPIGLKTRPEGATI
jgi:hypothetical protein